MDNNAEEGLGSWAQVLSEPVGSETGWVMAKGGLASAHVVMGGSTCKRSGPVL